MTETPDFKITIDQNEYLPPDGREVHAIVSIAANGAVDAAELRIWTPRSARLRFVKQVLPSVEDLTGKRKDVDPLSGDYPLGAWAAESRDYHICVELEPRDVGQVMRAAWIRLVVGDQVLASGNVLATWTHDVPLSGRINPAVAHYTGQAELAENIQLGLQAQKDGDLDTATTRLGRAVALAHESGEEAVARLLAMVVDVEDAATGTVRLRRNIGEGDEMLLDTRSTKTRRRRPRGGESRVRRRGAGDPAAVARGALTTPVRVYLSTGHDHQAVESALEELLEASGLEIFQRSPAVYGSWFRQFLARAKDGAPTVEESVSKLARGIELQALHRPQAEVDAQQADAVAKLMAALDKEENAAIQIGSILLVKVDNNYVVRTLTQLQLAHLERNPELFQDPATVLGQLQRALPSGGKSLCSCGSGKSVELCHPEDEPGSAAEMAN